MPEVKTSVISNQWVKQMEFTHKGDTMEGHKHVFDHPTLLSIGEFEVTVEGITSTYSAPVILMILKEKMHSIKCVSNSGLGYCLHILRDGEEVGDIVDPATIPAIGAVPPQSFIHPDEV